MASASGIVYTLSAEGNMPAYLKDVVQQLNAADGAAVKTASAFDRFNEVAKRMNQNAMVSNLETVSALFIQVGGNVSRVASITTSLIRPLTIVKELIGGVSVETLAWTGGTAALAISLVALYKGMEGVAQKSADALKELEKWGIGVSKENKEKIDAYTQSVTTLDIAWDKFWTSGGGAQAAEGFGGLNAALAVGVDLLTKMAATGGPPPQTKGAGAYPYDTVNANPQDNSVWGTAMAGLAYMQSPADAALELAENTAKAHEASLALTDILKNDMIPHEREATAELLKQIEALKKQNALLGERKDNSKPTKDMVGHGELGSSTAWNPFAELDQIGFLMKEGSKEYKDAVDHLADQMDQLMVKMRAEQRDATYTQGADFIAAVGVQTSTLTGVLTLLAGPLGRLVGGVFDAILQAKTVIPAFMEGIQAVFGDMPQVLGDVLAYTLPNVIRDIPELMGQWVLMGPVIVGGIINALPALAAAIVEALVQSIPLWANMTVEAMQQFGRDFLIRWEFFANRIVQALTDGLGDAFGTHLGKGARGHRELFGLHVDPIHLGNRTKPFQEIPSGLSMGGGGQGKQSRRGNSSTVNVGQVVVHASDPRKMAQDLRATQGPYGLGLNLAKLA